MQMNRQQRPESCSQKAILDRDNEGIKLPYGLDGADRLAHVSEVPSGLACGCRCPACLAPLVAHKGLKVVHHFAHHGDRICTSAMETMLHLLAKEVVSGTREILLPAVVAVVGNLREEVAEAKSFRYDEVETEVTMEGLKPDAVLRRDGRELLLEFAVTHWCEEAKLAELRRRSLPTVEIDLSRVPRDASRAEHAKYMLQDAPRQWLFNSRMVKVEDRLRAVAASRAEQDRRQRERLYERITNEVAAVWPVPMRAGDPRWLEGARDAGLGDVVGIPVTGTECFAVGLATWQAAFMTFAAIEIAGQTFAADALLRYLQRIGMLKVPFQIRRNWELELVSYLRGRIDGFRSPIEAITDYADWLVGQDVLLKTKTGWYADADKGLQARRQMVTANEARSREAKLRGRLEPLLALIPSGTEIADQWLERAIPEFGASPKDTARSGGRDFDGILARLAALNKMANPGSEPIEDSLLGLPLEQLRQLRRDESRRREETHRLENEEWQRQREERRRRESSAFVDSLTEKAMAAFGPTVGAAWVDDAIQAVTGSSIDAGRVLLGPETFRTLNVTFEQQRHRSERQKEMEQARRDQETRAVAMTARCRETLERRALSHFKDPERAALWLRSTQPSLGRSPTAHCIDDRSLHECVRLLDISRAGSTRRR